MADSRINAEYTFIDVSGKKSTKNLTDLSATATNAQIAALVEGLNSLTTNTLSQINRVETTDITGGGKTTPTVTWISPSSGTIPVSAFVNLINGVYGWYSAEMKIEGATFTVGEKFYVKTEPTNFGNASMFGGFATVTKSDEATLYIMAAKGNQSNPQPKDGDKFTVLIPETANSSATTITLTVTADEP